MRVKELIEKLKELDGEALAYTRGEPEDLKYWQGEAQRFGADHPGLINPMMDFERAVTTHARNTAVSRNFGMPVGVQPRDRVSMGMTRFGNLKTGEQ